MSESAKNGVRYELNTWNKHRTVRPNTWTQLITMMSVIRICSQSPVSEVWVWYQNLLPKPSVWGVDLISESAPKAQCLRCGPDIRPCPQSPCLRCGPDIRPCSQPPVSEVWAWYQTLLPTPSVWGVGLLSEPAPKAHVWGVDLISESVPKAQCLRCGPVTRIWALPMPSFWGVDMDSKISSMRVFCVCFTNENIDNNKVSWKLPV